MVCILCDSKTKITNSRYMRQLGHTWRRHTCTRCNAVFTTREHIDMDSTYRVQQAGVTMANFSRDKLFLSIYESLRHRQDSIRDATEITDTVMCKLRSGKRLVLPAETITQTSRDVLRHFDQASYTRYSSMHQATF